MGWLNLLLQYPKLQNSLFHWTTASSNSSFPFSIRSTGAAYLAERHLFLSLTSTDMMIRQPHPTFLGLTRWNQWFNWCISCFNDNSRSSYSSSSNYLDCSGSICLNSIIISFQYNCITAATELNSPKIGEPLIKRMGSESLTPELFLVFIELLLNSSMAYWKLISIYK